MHYMNYNNLETEVKKKLLEYDLISTTSKINLIPCHRIIIQGEYFSHFFTAALRPIFSVRIAAVKKLYMKILPWMFCHKNVPLLGHGDMCVDFRNIYRTVSQHFLNVADVDICFQQACGERVPIQYNKDKSENPCKIKGFRDLSLFFFRLFFIKIRLCKVGRKGQCYINDKITATGNGGMNGKQKLDCLQRNHRCL